MTPRILGLAALLLALASVPIRAQHVIGARDSLSARVDSVFRAFDRTDGPGCALGVYRDGRIVYARGYGMANLELGVPISPRTVFDVGSVSKQFAALTMLLLEQDGRLRLDDPVRRMIPELPGYADSVTWLHLLSHTGGVRDFLTLMSLAGASFEGYADTLDYMRTISRSATTNFPIGTRYLYSNSGWVLMAAAAKRATGRTISEFAEERIFRPLGMTDTRWHWDHTAIYPNRAQGYAPRQAGGFRIAMSQFSQFAGPGGVHTTVVDLLRWFENFDSARVGTREMLTRVQTPARMRDGSPVPAGGGSHYGLGLGLGSYRGLRTVSHGGAWAGYRAHVVRFPEQRLSAACLCNVTNAGPDTLVYKAAAVYLAPHLTTDTVTAWATALKSERRATLNRETLNRLAGFWRNDSLGEVRRTRLKGDTLLYGLGQLTPLIPLGPMRARLESPVEGLWEATFEGDSSGFPTRVRIRTRANTRVWHRVIPPNLAPAQLAEYAGEWYSPEIDATWVIAVDSSALSLTRGARRLRSTLENVGQDVFADRNSSNLLEFARDAQGRPATFLVQAGRVRNLRFERRPVREPSGLPAGQR
jgi:CubicO group peptidase (beta-lactamase class C family)